MLLFREASILLLHDLKRLLARRARLTTRRAFGIRRKTRCHARKRKQWIQADK